MSRSGEGVFNIFNCCSINVNSLINKVNYIKDFIAVHNLHVVSVCETWLTAGVASSFVEIEGYSFYRSDSPSEVRKHGVGVYVSRCLPAVPVEVGVDNVVALHLEVLGVEM